MKFTISRGFYHNFVFLNTFLSQAKLCTLRNTPKIIFHFFCVVVVVLSCVLIYFVLLFRVEASIVRIMKARKVLNHNNLITEVRNSSREVMRNYALCCFGSVALFLNCCIIFCIISLVFCFCIDLYCLWCFYIAVVSKFQKHVCLHVFCFSKRFFYFWSSYCWFCVCDGRFVNIFRQGLFQNRLLSRNVSKVWLNVNIWSETKTTGNNTYMHIRKFRTYATHTQHIRNTYATHTQHIHNTYTTRIQHMKNYFWGITQSTGFCLARKCIFLIFSCDKNHGIL